MNGPAVLDPRALERLKEWGGDKLLRQMVRLFLDNSPTRMDQIRAALHGGEMREAERAAHSLKSSAANIGAEGLRAAASDLEATAGTGDLHETRARLKEVEAAYDRVIVALKDVERGFEP